jgi:hypothetical protein
MSVRYEMTRAVVSAEQSDSVNAGKYAARPIKFETFILPNMTENRLVLKLVSGGLFHLHQGLILL